MAGSGSARSYLQQPGIPAIRYCEMMKQNMLPPEKLGLLTFSIKLH
jgi:hypothetical protein